MNKTLAQSLQIPWMDGTADVEGFKELKFTNIGEVISGSMQYVFLFAGVGLLLMLISGGFTFLTSAGDTKKLEQGRGRLTNAILGFVIIFVAFWLVQALGVIFGFDVVKDIFG